MRIINNRKGFTLVELVVSFALIAIFMTATLGVSAGALKVYNRVSQLAKARVVADMLAETVVAELQTAVAGGAGEHESILEVSGSQVAYKNRQGRASVLGAPDGRLQIEHPGNPTAVNTLYGENTYLRSRIERLTFERIGAERSLLRVRIRLRHEVTGFEYETSKIIECYNILPTQISG